MTQEFAPQSAVPRDVGKALALLRADPASPRSIETLAAACGVAPRTLQKHFRRFLGRTPFEVQCGLRLEHARRDLLRGPSDASVTAIALRWGFGHLGRFAGLYRRAYGESPSATLRNRGRAALGERMAMPTARLSGSRPTVGVLPFTGAAADAADGAAFAGEVEAALCRRRWISVCAPGGARYRLRGSLRTDGVGRLRAVVLLEERPTGRCVWADRWDGEREDIFAFQDRVAANTAAAVERAVRDTEIDRARHGHADTRDAWELTMRALPWALSVEAAAQARALELLARAMELAPTDPLPPAIAAWCHGQRGGHYLTARPDLEKQAAREHAGLATHLNGGDPLVEALAGAAYTLTHDLEPAARSFERALALDGACVWAWNRSGWVSLYRGDHVGAIERFGLARSIGPDDPMSFFCTIGIAAAHFEAGRYGESARWYRRGLAEHPSATWVNRFLAPAQALVGDRVEARRSLRAFAHLFPDLTIADVRRALPNTPRFLDRQSEGLEAAGMRP